LNDENLIPVTQLSPSVRKEICRKGAEATNRIKKQKKLMREVVQDMMKTQMDPELIEQLKDKFPFLKEGMDFQTAMVVGQLMSSVGGNSKAFELLSTMNDTESANKSNEYEKELSVEELRGLLDGTKSADNPKD
jgi:hypothetical protein